MGFSLETSVPALTVFIQGLLSFFSPCVLPLIPLYVGYLAGGAAKEGDDGTIEYPRKKVLVNTLFFVVGVSFAFFLLGFGFTALGQFFTGNQRVFSVVAGIVMAAFGLYMLGAFGKTRVIETEHRLPFNLGRFAMNPLVALVLGFTFSFAWTPCVGPVLASVLLMASSSASAATGFALVGVYTVGFVLPFLAVGLFTGEVLRFFRTHGNVVKYTVKVGGALLIVMGVMTVTGWMNGVTSYLSSFGAAPAAQEQPADQGAADVENGGGPDGSGPSDGASGSDRPSGSGSADAGAASKDGMRLAPHADLVLVDQDGTEHRLSDYRGKTVFLNFFATWCGPCQREIPDIEALYRDRGENAGEVVVLGVANPKSSEHPQNSDVGVDEVEAFIDEYGITYPVLMDTTGQLFSSFGVSSFPTTFMIDKDGYVFGYAAGMLTADVMDNIVDQTISGVRK
ncbi:cytochrome c biogenesis protein CcdA [Gordonibacter urolithinfaciens]|uniref:Redoxin domain-containing protein n=1 Tax=Gordonibacter urolithinfaciens TaxID=1335613 RepID=A0A6N8IIZ3_9ACTN|nr:cytochrome c biogenesis protein CcdA [Gordonibacter urolithinfaciens]MVM55425.1 redoxin domain-containing protein [Gordonibacter urolithinfaciens]MVN15807.1 redoxin domain-containing protein [Gordonibacter urolithinfaciens]MVN39139.1 redoxin domain-containing protein [Gordonibacter urolithinfaciens]MVN56365.1 redoxin domain-containing protein [Gordonibacter urolithinfaciens]MVN60389.1 redoxin domain-containing protein [Gordonibacter urolithinfaciens]